jgi:hypothetical protein
MMDSATLHYPSQIEQNNIANVTKRRFLAAC